MMFYYYFICLLISSISSCPLKTVDSRSGCYCGIEIDGTNYIQCQPYSIDKIPEFTRSYIHDKLNLSSNFIRNITNQSFNQLKIKKLFFQDNLIEYIDKNSFNNNLLNYLEELHLDMLHNGSLEFLCYGQWTKLRLLELSGFNLNQHQNCFEKFSRLEILIIKKSKIDFISSSLFQLPNLYELSLINNQIQYLNFDRNNFKVSTSIKIFNLSLNHINILSNDLFRYMPQLKILDLSYNLIEILPNMNYESQYLFVNLTSNLISHIEIYDSMSHYDLSLNPICTLDKNQIKSNVILKRPTKLHCDCRLAYYLNDNIENRSALIDIDESFDNETICSTPSQYHGLYLKDLTYQQLISVCSDDLPRNCREIKNFQQIQTYFKHLMETTTVKTTTTTTTAKAVTQKSKLLEDVTTYHSIAPFRLTSFYTVYEDNNLLIYWDFDRIFPSNYLKSIQFQIIIEQESSKDPEIIRRTSLISLALKKYTIYHIAPNQNYYVCLLITRPFYGTDKYCRETRTLTPISSTTIAVSNAILSKQALVNMLFTNRSIVFGFIFGTMITAALLLTLAFICHLRSKREHYRRAASSLFHSNYPHQQQQQYLYIDKAEDEAIYSNSILSSSSSSKYNHYRKARSRTCFPTAPSNHSWYHRGLTQIPTLPPAPPCCFHRHQHSQTPDTTMSSSTTTRRITTLSSQYSNGIDKEPMTSTSIMSSTSSDDQTSNIPVKHVYEELADETTMLRRNNTNDVFL